MKSPAEWQDRIDDEQYHLQIELIAEIQRDAWNGVIDIIQNALRMREVSFGDDVRNFHVCEKVIEFTETLKK